MWANGVGFGAGGSGAAAGPPGRGVSLLATVGPGGGSGSLAWTPPQAGLLADFDSAFGLYQDTAGTVPAAVDGAPVRRRNSRTGAAYLTAAASTATLAVGAWAGQSAVRFLGASGKQFDSTGLAIAEGRAFTFFRVHRCTARGSPAGATGSGVAELGNGNYFWAYADAYASNKVSGLGGPKPINERLELLTLVSTGAGIVWRQNGVVTFNDGSLMPAGALPAVSVGGFASNGAYPWHGDDLRVLVYDRIVSGAELTGIESALLGLYPPYSVADYPVLRLYTGDSIMSGVAATTNANEAPSLAEAALADGAGWLNTAYPGSTIGDWTNTFRATGIDPYYAAGRAKNDLLFWAGTNDIAQAGQTGAQTYARMVAFVAAMHTAGWRVVVLDCLPRSSFNGTQEGYRVTYNGDLAAAVANATGNPRVFTASAGDFPAGTVLVRVSQIANLADPANTTYYADGTHPTDAGNALVAADVEYAAGLL